MLSLHHLPRFDDLLYQTEFSVNALNLQGEETPHRTNYPDFSRIDTPPAIHVWTMVFHRFETMSPNVETSSRCELLVTSDAAVSKS